MATSKKARTRPARPTALVHAQHREPPVKLTTKEHALLDEGLERGRSFARKTEDELASFGAWLLGSVFGGDAREALDDKSKNPVWMRSRDVAEVLSRATRSVLGVRCAEHPREAFHDGLRDSAHALQEPYAKRATQPSPSARAGRPVVRSVSLCHARHCTTGGIA
ncbi:MAG TPA: hypothetical protein VF316_09725 [Polyangiaceae bacterium]